MQDSWTLRAVGCGRRVDAIARFGALRPLAKEGKQINRFIISSAKANLLLHSASATTLVQGK